MHPARWPAQLHLDVAEQPSTPLPFPSLQAPQWQVLVVLLLKALSLERCPPLRPHFETREGISRLGRLLAGLSFTSEEFYAALELLCPVEA